MPDESHEDAVRNAILRIEMQRGRNTRDRSGWISGRQRKMSRYPAALMLTMLAVTCTGCGGLTRAVGVVPNTLDRLCEDTRPPERADECKAP